MVKDAMIKTNMGEIPVVDYLDIRAGQLGYEDYNEMKADGLCLEEEKLLTPALENIILHIKYQEPINFNGFVVENDTITFDSQEELNNYVNGKAVYDVLDNCVKKNDNEILLYAENQKGNVVWGTKDLGGQYTETFDYSGFPYTVIDKWQNDAGILSIGELKADDGTRYAANVNDVTELFHGKYEYEFGTDKPDRSDVENMHLDHISEIDIDRHEAEYGADGSRAFPHLNDTSHEEEQEEPTHVRRKCR